MTNSMHKVAASVLCGLVVAAGGALGAAACASMDGQSFETEDQAAVASTEQALGRHAPRGPRAKYVLFFIGDGMASVQIHAAEAYLANKEEHDDVGGSAKAQLLNLSKLPVQGMQRTYPWNSLITDSAPAATSMATGKKTADGVISMDPTKTQDLTTIAEVAHQAGMKVGIVSSVSIDHATPAAFYAHEPSRNSYHYIGHDLVASGFDYFGGGGLIDPDGTRSGVTPQGNVLEAAAAAGYVIADTRDEFEHLRPGKKALAINPVLDSSKALYYEIDRVHADDADSHISLAEYTQKGIDLLYDRDGKRKGFFMMVEGGKIDWSCHANDARTTIDDTIAFDDAVKVGIDFLRKHPKDTLIVVTGDHETGGMTIGWAGTAYASYFEKMEGQKLSYLEFDKRIKAVKDAGSLPDTIVDTSLDEDMLELLGLDYANLTEFEKQRVDDAYTKAMFGDSTNTAEEDGLLYGSYNPLSVTITHILNNRSGIGWTSYSHTAVPVPVLAGGTNSEIFDGYYENTDIALKFADAMGLRLPN
ncbi:MAG: alkaline phosphatase [Polyangiaceae bacterium]|nr:alkaline phosphatase [Polyangiaceae bacterium]